MTPSPVSTAHLYVIDACSFLALLFRENGAVIMDGLVSDTSKLCIVHAVNLCEVYYDVLRRHDTTQAKLAVEKLQALGVETRTDLDEAFVERVGELKVNPGKLSLADCFTLALALRTGATLVTADHHEFDRIDALGLCPILFIR